LWDPLLEELRGTLFVPGHGTRVALNGRTGIVKKGDAKESSWAMQAARLLQQAVDWIEANRQAIDQARAQRARKSLE
jgi:hypothetical protein